MATQKVAVVWCGHFTVVWCGNFHGNLCPIPAHARDPRIDAAVADDWCWGAESEREAIAADGRYSAQGVAEYERV
jgi:hypothetical protein|tara:strand:+ start:1110 stop:1334 length:225 start_codon:yes stop_codon:yes gene_type:complete